MKLYSRTNYDSKAQRESTICPFCEENLDTQYLVWTWTFLKIIHNKYPFCGKQDHFLVIPKRHITLTSQMTGEEFQELREVEKWMKEQYKAKSFFSFIREQSPEKSVAHLHYHFCSWDISSEVLEQILKASNS